jgi:NADH-quinone oxidoreductase subunit I
MRATSSSGDHRYEGSVHWAGELGYGVRAPEVGQSGATDFSEGNEGEDS